MSYLRKYYIKKREQILNSPNDKCIRLIFNKDTTYHNDIKTDNFLTTKQLFPKYQENWPGSGGVTLQDKIKVYNELSPYLRKTHLNLIAVQIANKWYTGSFITRSRFDRPMEQLFSLLLNRKTNLEKS